MKQEGKRCRLDKLFTQLDIEYSSFKPLHMDLADYILPARARFNLALGGRGDRRNQKIINSTAVKSAAILRSGMMAGITSPARPWFRLTTPDPDLAEFEKVKRWLHIVTQRMTAVFARSNLYNTLAICYGDMGVFGTAPISIEEDFDRVIRTQSFPIGSYRIAKDAYGQVNVFAREFKMTVRQLVQMFGRMDKNGKPDWSVFTKTVRSQFERGEYESWVEVRHIIQPNTEYNEQKLLSKYKKYISCYYEKGSGDQGEEDTLLSEKGYDRFPIKCPRWQTTGEDVYGTDYPGVNAIGDVKQLQLMEKRSAQNIELVNKPPMVGSGSLQKVRTSVLPGDVTFDDSPANQGFRPAFQVNPQIHYLENKIEKIESRIRSCFYEDIFLMLANDERSGITATEITERKEEKLLALGPVLEQVNGDLLDPTVDDTFEIMLRQGEIPEPPEEIQGIDLKVEYISIMQQAQKAQGIGAMERLIRGTTEALNLKQLGNKKINIEQWVDSYADNLGVSPAIIRSDDEVVAMEQEEQAAMVAAQQAQMIEAGAGVAKNLSQSDMESDNALTRLLDAGNAGEMVEGV